MKKIALACALASVLVMNCANASADTVFQLNETFQSGATFSGKVTFSNALDNLLGVTGTLSGGSYGTADKISWTWYEGAYQKPSGTFAANTNAHYDWLVDGTAPSNASHHIELDWVITGGMLALTNIYGSGSAGQSANAINYLDQMVTYNVSAVPEPETLGMMLVSLGVIGFVARRRRVNA